MLDVAVIADLCIDILVQGDVTPAYGQAEQLVDEYRLELGGSAAIFAAQFIRLGGRVGLFGLLGEDLFGDYLRRRLAEIGLPTDHLYVSPGRRTPVSIGLVRNGDRAMLTHKGSMQDIDFVDVHRCGLLTQARHLHIASYFLLDHLQSDWPRTLDALRARGTTVSLDTNWSPDERWDSVRDLLDRVDVFLPNEEEALRISGRDTVEEAGAWLSRRTKLTVIKRGALGAMVFDGAGMQPFAVPQPSLRQLVVVDTTGAGDNFDAGFLLKWLEGAPLGDCVRLGIDCAVASLSCNGGIDGQLRRVHGALVPALTSPRVRAVVDRGVAGPALTRPTA